MQESTSLAIKDVFEFKQKLLLWAEQFDIFVCLDSNEDKSPYGQVAYCLAVDAIQTLELYKEAAQFELFKDFQAAAKQTVYGYFSYDLKNEIEQLTSNNEDNCNFPSCFFFEPRYVIRLEGAKCIFNRSTLESMYLFDQINAMEIPEKKEMQPANITWESKVDKNTYLKNVAAIRKDIEEGTVYELNYCREMFVENITLNPIQAFLEINQNASAPFTALLKIRNRFALSFSPERFMQLMQGEMLSQPIKGTLKKGSTEAENLRLKEQLLSDEKERAENVMIVDLVRNDFAKSAEVGSVKVPELFGIYSFKNILQMISTVSAQKRKEVHPVDALKNAFPMGSMTGAPKVKAMELIEKYEISKRGLYSGAIGYMTKENDFDFNVVIRTLIYDSTTNYLSLHVGGAITYDSIAEKEWEETNVKAASILQFLG